MGKKIVTTTIYGKHTYIYYVMMFKNRLTYIVDEYKRRFCGDSC